MMYTQKTIVALFASVALLLPGIVLAQQTGATPEVGATEASAASSGVVSCFDYYKFGSIQISLESEVRSTVSGVPMNFIATLSNENDYPVVEGAVYAKVFRKQSGQAVSQANGGDLVDQFFVADGISIAAHGKKVSTFSWNVPTYAVSGDYQIAMFFTSAKEFNLLGLSFTDDIVGNIFNFSVSGEQDRGVGFNKNTVTINNEAYRFAAFPLQFKKDEDIAVTADLVNRTKEYQAIPVTWKLYAWDGQKEENLIDTRSETIELKPNETRKLSYVIQDKNQPVYYLVAEAQYKDAKSILDIRAYREGADKAKLNFPAITKYPLKKGEENTLFTCAHNSGTAEAVDNTKVVLTLLDENQRQIHQYTYVGAITGAMMGLRDVFTPTKDYTNFTLKAELYTDDALVESASMKYDCESINPASCPDINGFTMNNPYIRISVWIMAVLALGALLAVFFTKRRKLYANTLIICLVGVATLLGGADAAKASEWTYTGVTGQISVPSNSLVQTYSGLVNFSVPMVDGQFHIYYPTFTESYSVGAINQTANQVITSGSSVSVGAVVHFFPNRDTLSWFMAGFGWSSPYGYWMDEGTNPPGCSSSDFIAKEAGDLSGGLDAGSVNTGLKIVTVWPYYYNVYSSFAVKPPTVSVSHAGSTAGLNCNSDGTTCTITSAGTVESSFTFASTYGNLWASYKGMQKVYAPASGADPRCKEDKSGNWGYWEEDLYDKYYVQCPVVVTGEKAFTSCVTKPNPVYTQTIPGTVLTHSFTVVQSNTSPSTPTVTCPSTGTTGASYQFTASAVDPDNDNVKYGYDWDTNGTIDQYMPASGYVGSGIAQSATKSWTSAGTKTVKVQACDNKGTCSGWGSCSIKITEPPDACGTLSGTTPRVVEPTTGTNACLKGAYTNSPANTTKAWNWSCGTVKTCTAPKYGCTEPADTNYNPSGADNKYGCSNTCKNGAANYPTCTFAPCAATTIAGCTLPASNSGTSAGSCVSGLGSCNYTCVDGGWNENANDCEPPIAVAVSPTTYSATLPVHTASAKYTLTNATSASAKCRILDNKQNPVSSYGKCTGSVIVSVPSVAGIYGYYIEAKDNYTGNTTKSNNFTVLIAAAPPAPCAAATIAGCTLPASNSGTSAGSCVSGIGGCNYTCTNGNWNENSNTCEEPISITVSPTTYNATLPVHTVSAKYTLTNATADTAKCRLLDNKQNPISSYAKCTGSITVSAPSVADTYAYYVEAKDNYTSQTAISNGFTVTIAANTPLVNCAATTISGCALPTTAAGNSSNGVCSTGYSGSCADSCSPAGVWGPTSPSCTVNSCTNGATNPPVCNTCSSGYKYDTVSGSCVLLASSATISADPKLVPSGKTSTITWSATDVTSCAVSGPGLSSSAKTGSASVTISTQAVFTISCDSGAVTDSVMVNVVPSYQEF